MVKKFLTIAALILLLTAGYKVIFQKTALNFNNYSPSIGLNTPNTSPEKPDLNIEFGDKIYSYSKIEVNDVSKTTLFSNLDKKLTSREILKSSGCKSLVSGGFYTKDDKPIGLLISEGQTLNYAQNSSLFNSFIYITFDDKVAIASRIPYGSMRLALQSGPLLIKDGVKQQLKLKNDEEARRVVVGTINDKTMVFLAIYKTDSLFVGPNLVDLPEITSLISEKENINLKDALNLDGGTASAFLSINKNISELASIGSYFCIK